MQPDQYDDAKRFGELLKTKREGKDLSLEAVAAGVWGKPQRAADLSRYENAVRIASPATAQRLCAYLDIQPSEIPALFLWPSARIALGETESRILEKYRTIAGSLDHISAAETDELIFIATKFSVDEPEKLSTQVIRAEIEKRTEEYRRLRELFDATDEELLGLGKIKADAQRAMEALDFTEVERLLANAHSTEIRGAAATAELRAANALLDGRTKDALTLYRSTAESFVGVDLGEASRRRYSYVEKLYDHAERTGNGFEEADELARIALSVLEHGEIYAGRQWTGILAGLQNLLASIGFQKSLTKKSGDSGDALNSSIDLYRLAIDGREQSGDGSSVDGTIINLAQALVLRAELGLSKNFDNDRDEAVELMSDLIDRYGGKGLDETWAKAKIGLAKAIDATNDSSAMAQMAYMRKDIGENRVAARRHVEEAIEHLGVDDHIGRALAHLYLAQLYIKPLSPLHYRQGGEIRKGIGILKSAALMVAVEDYPHFHSVVRQNRKVAQELLVPDENLID